MRSGWIFLVLLGGFWLLKDTCVHAQSAPEKAPEEVVEEEPLRILSWNIYMLPPLVRQTGKRRRSKAIAEQVNASDYHILVFQEAFLPAARRILRKELKEKYPYEYGPACKRAISLRTNSGIWILSSFPLKELGEVEFEDCATFDDCFAHKGALMVEGDWNGQTFQVVGTHLNAGGPDSIKVSQYNDIHNHLLKPFLKENVPQILCGDMNTARKDTTLYSQMLTTFGCLDGPFAGDMQFTTYSPRNDMGGNSRGKVIDYIFYRGNGKEPRKIRRCIPIITKRWSKKHENLSDHFPVEGYFWW